MRIWHDICLLHDVKLSDTILVLRSSRCALISSPKITHTTVTVKAAGEQLWTPLHLAGMRGHTQAVILLVKRGADHKAQVRAMVAVEVIQFLVFLYSISACCSKISGHILKSGRITSTAAAAPTTIIITTTTTTTTMIITTTIITTIIDYYYY